VADTGLRGKVRDDKAYVLSLLFVEWLKGSKVVKDQTGNAKRIRLFGHGDHTGQATATAGSLIDQATSSRGPLPLSCAKWPEDHTLPSLPISPRRSRPC